MGIKVYRKLVRDNIPHIIAQSGATAAISVLSAQAYAGELDRKLMEETREYLESGEAEELADILEVVYAIAEHRGIGREGLEQTRLHKRETNGGFMQRLFLESVREP